MSTPLAICSSTGYTQSPKYAITGVNTQMYNAGGLWGMNIAPTRIHGTDGMDLTILIYIVIRRSLRAVYLFILIIIPVLKCG